MRRVAMLLLLLTAQMFAGCIPALASDFFYNPGLPSNVTGPTTSKAQGDIRVLTNLWYTSTRYTVVVDGKTSSPGEVDRMLSSNLAVSPFPVADVAAHYRNIKSGHVPGVTLLFDFPYPAFPDNLGTWIEVLLPLYSQLALGTWKGLLAGGQGGRGGGGAAGDGGEAAAQQEARYVDRVMLVNLKRSQIQSLHWVWHMLRLTLRPGTAPGRQLPRLVFFDELEYLDQSLWLCYEAAVSMKDKGAGGRAGFASPEIGRRFREEAYKMAGIKTGVPQQPDRTITYLMSVGGEVVYNNDDVMSTLYDIADFLEMRAMPTSLTPAASFHSFVSTMSRTGVLVTRHGPQLASTIFLPPGAVVMELLAFNWDWRGTSDIYHNATSSLGDLHHFAWRAPSSRWAVYGDDPTDNKYKDWNIEECTSSRQCLEVHARAGMVVDTSAVHETLMDTLPGVLYRNASVAALRRPFPKGAAADASTGFWSDK